MPESPTAGLLLRRLHRDQQGVMSIVSVFAMFLLTLVLGMVMNVSRQVDGKIRMQNAADAAAFSGGVVLARGMNLLAFSNHLLCDVFALTAFLYEAARPEDSAKFGEQPGQNAASFVSRVLAAWNVAGDSLSHSDIPKFDRLGSAIKEKIKYEQELVAAYTNLGEAAATHLLPIMREILGSPRKAEEPDEPVQDGLIPEFQRAVRLAYPRIAQTAAMEMARRNGQPGFGRGPMLGVLWRPDPTPMEVGGIYESESPSLPVVDPQANSAYRDRARADRESYAKRYLGLNRPPAWSPWGGWQEIYGVWRGPSWNAEALVVFDRYGRMSQFANLWRTFTCGYLNHLLNEEYPETNLPFVILDTEEGEPHTGTPTPATNQYLQDHYTFIGVSYWRQLHELMPRLFANPTKNDAVAFAAVRLFVSRRNLAWLKYGKPREPDSLGGIVGGQLSGEGPGENPPGSDDPSNDWYVGRAGGGGRWDLFNQRWTCQLVPAQSDNLARVLAAEPKVADFVPAMRGPDFGRLDIDRVSSH